MLKALDQEDDRRGNDATTLKALEAKKAKLEETQKTADEEVNQRETAFKNFETHDATVTAQREELAALNALMKQIKSQIDLTEVERMAQERITKIDDATLASPAATPCASTWASPSPPILGFGLVVLGIAFCRVPVAQAQHRSKSTTAWASR